MTDELRAKLLKVFPLSAVEIGELYGPALARLALSEFLTVLEMIQSSKAAEAQAAIRAAMTGEELASEKESLAVLTRQMAEDQAEGFSIGKAILMAGLKAGFAVALAGVGL